jgi:hypothetical protein
MCFGIGVEIFVCACVQKILHIESVITCCGRSLTFIAGALCSSYVADTDSLEAAPALAIVRHGLAFAERIVQDFPRADCLCTTRKTVPLIDTLIGPVKISAR